MMLLWPLCLIDEEADSRLGSPREVPGWVFGCMVASLVRVMAVFWVPFSHMTGCLTGIAAKRKDWLGCWVSGGFWSMTEQKAWNWEKLCRCWFRLWGSKICWLENRKWDQGAMFYPLKAHPQEPTSSSWDPQPLQIVLPSWNHKFEYTSPWETFQIKIIANILDFNLNKSFYSWL